MISAALISHPACAKHEMGEGHPEQIKRLAAVREALERDGVIDTLLAVEAEEASVEDLHLAHPASYVDSIMSAAQRVDDYVELDPDTRMNAYSLRAARYAAGAGITALKGIKAGEFSRAFCLVRPPGHHAEKEKAMGFCIFNSVAIAAMYARKHLGIERVAIVDFDVHHGNGSEDICGGEKGILLCSSYEHPLYPFSNTTSEYENCLHYPMPSGTGSEQFRQCYSQELFPALREFRPQLLLVSAGFDGHAEDPLANWQLADNDYQWLGQQLRLIANEQCQGVVVSFLEGGYHLSALGRSACAYVKEMSVN